jgi:hypothetical protein
MDRSAELTAADLINDATERDLADIFKRYGEERYARQIARMIARRRPLTTSFELVDVVKSAIPAPARFGDGHPAKRVFQALRIAVNDELGALERALPAALEALGRPARGDQLPFARGSDREDLHARRRARLHVPARLPHLRLRKGAAPPRCVTTAAAAGRRRGRAEPACDVGEAPRRSQGLMPTTAYAEAAPAEGGRRPRPVAARRADPLRSGVVWIVVVGVLLAGLVALNVAVLQLNVRLDRLGRDRVMLRDQNAALASQFSSAKASPRIQARAQQRLGLVPAGDMTYVDLRKP